MGVLHRHGGFGDLDDTHQLGDAISHSCRRKILMLGYYDAGGSQAAFDKGQRLLTTSRSRRSSTLAADDSGAIKYHEGLDHREIDSGLKGVTSINATLMVMEQHSTLVCPRKNSTKQHVKEY